MWMNEHDRQELTKLIEQEFSTMGGGQTSEWNFLVNALTDKPLMFAAGVDVRGVIDLIVNSIDSENNTLVKELKG